MKRLLLLLVFSSVVAGVLAQTIYFPIGKDGNTGLSTKKLNFYSSILRGLKEPILFKDRSGSDIYRFEWLRAFHHPIVIRIEKTADSYTLFWKETNKEGGGYDGKIFANKQKMISKSAWDNFQALLKDADFWNLEIKDEQSEREGAENDGAQWILEGKTKDKYHVLTGGARFHTINFISVAFFYYRSPILKLNPLIYTNCP